MIKSAANCPTFPTDIVGCNSTKNVIPCTTSTHGQIYMWSFNSCLVLLLDDIRGRLPSLFDMLSSCLTYVFHISYIFTHKTNVEVLDHIIFRWQRLCLIYKFITKNLKFTSDISSTCQQSDICLALSENYVHYVHFKMKPY